MRVLVIHNRYNEAGGEDTVFRNESALLFKKGHVVEQVVFDNKTIRSWSDKLLAGILAAYNPASAHAIQEKIESFEPEVIHVHNFTPLVSPSVFFVANRNRVPIVLTLHNFRLLCPSSTLFYHNSIYERSLHSFFPWDAVRKGVYRGSVLQSAAVASVNSLHNLLGTWQNRVDRYIIPTAFAKGKFRDSILSLPEEKLVVKPNFVENSGKGLPHRENFFLFVGRLSEEKGIRTLLAAAEKSSFSLVIIGDGPLRPLVEASTQTNQRLTYLGYQKSPTVLDYLKRCSGLLFPSICYEGFPVTILEAFSTGTLVLASRLGALAEIIDDDVNGLHFEAGNATDLMIKMAEANHYPDRSKKIAERGYQTYLELYTPEKNYEQLMGIYHQVVAEKNGKPAVTVSSAELEHTNK